MTMKRILKAILWAFVTLWMPDEGRNEIEEREEE